MFLLLHRIVRFLFVFNNIIISFNYTNFRETECTSPQFLLIKFQQINMNNNKILIGEITKIHWNTIIISLWGNTVNSMISMKLCDARYVSLVHDRFFNFKNCQKWRRNFERLQHLPFHWIFTGNIVLLIVNATNVF